MDRSLPQIGVSASAPCRAGAPACASSCLTEPPLRSHAGRIQQHRMSQIPPSGQRIRAEGPAAHTSVLSAQDKDHHPWGPVNASGLDGLRAGYGEHLIIPPSADLLNPEVKVVKVFIPNGWRFCRDLNFVPWRSGNRALFFRQARAMVVDSCLVALGGLLTPDDVAQHTAAAAG